MDFLFFVQTGLYFLISILGFFVTAPVAATVNNFNGNCVLYGEIRWFKNNEFKFKPGADSVCEFNIYLHVGICMLFALFMGGIHVFLIVKDKRNETLEIPKVVRLSLIVANGICAFLTLVSAGTLSAGLSQWCSYLMEGKDHYAVIETCSDAQHFQWHNGIDGSSFHTCLAFAVVSAWLLLVLWLAQFGIGLFKFLRGKA